MPRSVDGPEGLVHPSSTPGRLPDFIVIGAMKSGTTTLFELLRRHSRVFMCDPKEPQYFSRDHVFARGESWYRSLFAGAAPEQVCGEASTCYSRWPHFGDVARRIAEHVPDVRLMYIMRHPVERAYSHYSHIMQARMLEADEPVISFEAALEEIPEILDASLYMKQIAQYLQHFPPERLLALTLDELESKPSDTLARVQEFLGIPAENLTAVGEIRSNTWGDRATRYQMRTLLERIRRAPILRALIDLAPASARAAGRSMILRSSALRSVAARRVRSERQELGLLRPETRNSLLERLEGPTRELEAFLDRPLPSWRE